MRDGKGKQLIVKARSYESTVKTFQRVPDVLKIDIEGLEVEFLVNLAKSPEIMPPVINVDMDSICCCMAADGVGCSELSKLGWQAIKAMKDAGYSVVGDNSSWVADVTFYLEAKILP